MTAPQHERFLARVTASSAAVFAVAYWLHRRGHAVEIAGQSFAPTAADAPAFFDNGDLFVIEPSRRRRIEVKGLNRYFTSRQDWPFGNQLFVASCASVDRSGDIECWITVSASLRHIAYLPETTRDRWYVAEKRFGNTGNVERVYACSPDLAQFIIIDGPPPSGRGAT